MSNEKRDHVPISTDSGVVWDFVIPSAATTCSEQSQEMEKICGQLFDCFGDFLTPIELSYNILLYQEDCHLPWGDEKPEQSNEVNRTLRDESGFSKSSFVASTQVSQSGVRWIPSIRFDQNTLKIRFPDGDRVVSRTECVAYVKNEPVNWEPTWDPLSMYVAHIPNTRYQELDSTFNFHIRLSLRSGVWIEQTKSGEINRTYLSEFFKRIADTLPVEKIDREVYPTSDLWVDLGLESQLNSFDPKQII